MIVKFMKVIVKGRSTKVHEINAMKSPDSAVFSADGINGHVPMTKATFQVGGYRLVISCTAIRLQHVQTDDNKNVLVFN